MKNTASKWLTWTCSNTLDKLHETGNGWAKKHKRKKNPLWPKKWKHMKIITVSLDTTPRREMDGRKPKPNCFFPRTQSFPPGSLLMYKYFRPFEAHDCCSKTVLVWLQVAKQILWRAGNESLTQKRKSDVSLENNATELFFHFQLLQCIAWFMQNDKTPQSLLSSVCCYEYKIYY